MPPFEIVTTADRPDLHPQFDDAFRSSWPEFIFHDPIARQYADMVQQRFARFDVTIVQGNMVVAGGWGVALAWDATIDDLPGGYDDTLVRTFSVDDETTRNTLSVMAVAVHRDYRGHALSSLVLSELRRRAQADGLTRVIVPVRPTLKASYPLTPMATFARWRRPDGKHLDPWIRTHERLGATILAPAHRSMIITGTVAQWESWTQMALPESGTYVVPGALELVVIDRSTDEGIYVEPNLWMRHV
jgi:GNAT superfamily N-acetyltransferase